MTREMMIKDVAEYWGDRMPMMLMEECGELIQAVSKFERSDRKDDAKLANVKEEIRDMLISIGAVMKLYDIDQSEIEDMIGKKLQKKY